MKNQSLGPLDETAKYMKGSGLNFEKLLVSETNTLVMHR